MFVGCLRQCSARGDQQAIICVEWGVLQEVVVARVVARDGVLGKLVLKVYPVRCL